MNGDDVSDDDQMTSSRSRSRLGIACCLGRHRSVENSRSNSIASTSRNNTTNRKRTNHAKSKSMENFDNTPSTLNSSRSLRKPSHLKSRNGSSRKSTPIMYSNSSGMLKPPPIEKNIECTLEELCYGCTKKIMIRRDVLTDNGGIVQEEELLTINVKPGWTKGTKIKFVGKGNERPNAYSEDIIFSISEKRHQLFRREGNDLELCVEIPLLKALTGGTILVPLLGGENMNLTVDDIIYPGYEKIISDQGMPISSAAGKRGKLIVKFIVEFPTHLSDNQRCDVFSILQNSC
ncbi:dnaJ homolog subfamily B member 13-like [Trifolium pratense]|uniref:dnaJ homolog subfamily B member 13-like n=1 Tax=Trifolium pratense TaxID=57577 RepID=UPI001E693435|nr:dnaJ homolog subfamily B member 13-like [Trifolium pratense]